MKRLNQLLIVALTAQFVIAGGLYFTGQSLATVELKSALLDVSPDKIAQITIVDEDDGNLVLEKMGGKWILPKHHRLPASAGKVEKTLQTLASSKRGWPVVTSESGRERFKLLEDSFAKKVILADGEKPLQTLYFGTSPGYRQVYVRVAGEDEVFSIKFDRHELAARNDEWLDQSLIQPTGEVVSLQGPDFSLHKRDGDWIASSGTGVAVNEEVTNLVDSLAKIRVSATAGRPPLKIDHELKLRDQFADYTYRFFKVDDEHFIGRNDYTQAFKISKSDYENIVGKTATQLVRDATSGSSVPVIGSGGENMSTPANPDPVGTSSATSESG